MKTHVKKNEDFSLKVQRRLTKLRVDSGKPLHQISRDSGVSVYKLKRIESGAYDMLAVDCIKLIRYYRASPEEVLK